MFAPAFFDPVNHYKMALIPVYNAGKRYFTA